MWKKIIVTILLIACIGLLVTAFIKESMKTNLAETVKINEQYEDYIIHIRIEAVNDGFQVLRSLEYTGDEKVEIKHRNPLTAVTINKDNPVFTGSDRTMVLNPGNNYHPQEPVEFSNLPKGSHTVYIHTQFFVDGERVDIKSKGELKFE
ncbi:hypothetical protein SAMN04487944_11469 [Gracilibacillus ureilyticus]|uniref:Uncharacterized protein n=1 Tax=Gracilibacillus ureilyticus TaxID=531814 RepID=A0A1H9TLW7_9BACI|nr:hypothetical protein [Gracilibacillus ureilyticus]SER98185.1 hypothetical protein SAMN04487944_11469 [Gracilibacillus ureilyticus]